jgi:hypothetical protein
VKIPEAFHEIVISPPFDVTGRLVMLVSRYATNQSVADDPVDVYNTIALNVVPPATADHVKLFALNVPDVYVGDCKAAADNTMVPLSEERN